MNKKLILIVIAVLFIVAVASYFFPSPLQVTRVHTNTNHSVSAEELAKAKSLFQKNSIDMGTLAVVEVLVDERGETHVWSKQFYNNLPVFRGNIVYHFDSSGKARDRLAIDGTKSIFTSGERVGSLNLSIEPKVSMYTAARMAREKMKSNYLFTAELGLLDLDAGTSYATPNFVLAWRIKPRGAETYPYADIDANSGKLLMYDNGIRY